jgi:hypothetical protein
MKNSKKVNSEKSFLEQNISKEVSKRHSIYLGTEIPEGYFVSSKSAILERIKNEEADKKPIQQKGFWLKPYFKYAIAASLILMFGVAFWLQNFNKTNQEITNDFELLSFSDDVLLNSIFIEDAQMEAYSNITLVNEIVIKAELSEQKMDDILLNSLFVEDSLLDNYTDKNFLEVIIL